MKLTRAVADADPALIESTARQLGESRRILRPVAWAAGTVVLLVAGVKLLIVNWRLSLIQLVPAAWVWLAMWNVKRHIFQDASFRQMSTPALVVLAVVIVLFTIIAMWCNTVFAYAVDGPPPPRIAWAVRQAKGSGRMYVSSGLVVGAALALTVVVLPRIAGIWTFGLVMAIVLAVMLVSFVAVPARIIGVRQQRLPVTENLGRLVAGGALSAVVMGPGFLLGRIGLILLGLHHFHVLGFVMLSVGTALYAAGMSSVKAIKLSMKLTSPAVTAAEPAVSA
ncbi:hypothetical protein [Jatrophihabitans sp. GAS493]|uniref:hypothetical protein n=1 Tax=Jatrophihabitans sp. GAS493 TaxID=1907575 RepID=UPI0012FDF08C|nr:hypothetical protein [Jatrophihabitans sp. GAS493]